MTSQPFLCLVALHVTYTCGLCTGNMYFILLFRQIRRSAGEEVTNCLVTALVLSRLDYCNALLAGLPESTIKPLQRVQNAALLVSSLTLSQETTSLQFWCAYTGCRCNHEFSTNCASWCTSFTPTSNLPTWPRWLNSLQHLRRVLASGLPGTSCTGSHRWKPSSVSEPSVISALLPGTFCHTIFSPSQTLNISRNISKLTCLHRHFNSFICLSQHGMSAGLFCWWTISLDDDYYYYVPLWT